MRELLANIPSRLSVLDVPFGTGRFVPFYLEKEMKVHGVDISQDMICAAEKALGEQFGDCTVQVADATNLPYADRSFDLVTSFRFLDVILPYGAARRALSEFSRVARNYVILELSERKTTVFRSRLPRDDEAMGGMLYPEELKHLLQNAQLTIVTKSEPISDSGAWQMFAYVCEKTA
jgi:ubiquinone/menaquinone biosynthesis C-methylase UbiE